MTPIQKTEEEWKKELTPEQYAVLREKGTERAFIVNRILVTSLTMVQKPENAIV